jgi:uncharacterized protein (AIM24 family)
MSSVSIQGNASGTGIFTIASPNSNTNRTLTLPDATGTIITTAGGAAISGTTGSFSGDLSFNSGYGSAAVAYGCRAWVNFNGTGTVAIRASGNVSSITDNGTGDYTVNFTTAMPDANYSVTTSGFESQGSYVTSGFGIRSGTAPTTSSVRGSCISYAGSYVDPTYVLVVIFR